MPCERLDVLPPLAKRRHRDGHDPQPVVEVLAEAPFPDVAGKIAVRRGDDPCVGGGRAAFADALERPLLQHAQQLHLEREPVFIDFWVFEKKTTIRWSILMSVLLGVLLDRIFTIAWRRRKKNKAKNEQNN